LVWIERNNINLHASNLYSKVPCTKIGDINSFFLHNVTCYIPQGSALGPWKFLKYV